MKFKANTAPIETLEIECNDKTFICRFNTLAQYYIESEFEPFLGLIKKAVTTPYEVSPILLYGMLKSVDSTITFDFALRLAGEIGKEGLTVVYNYVTKMIGEDEEEKKQIAPQDHKKSTKKATTKKK